MALVLDQERRFNNLFRTLLFVPWAVPIVIVSLNWRWIYDDFSGFLNNFLITFHITHEHHLLALRSPPRHGVRHRRRGVGGHALLHDELPGRAPGDPQGALRGRRDRRRLDRPAVPLHHRPAAPHDLPDDGHALDDLDRHEPPVRLHPHQGRPGESDGDLPAPLLHDGARGLPPRDGRGRLPRLLSRAGPAHRLPHAPHASASATSRRRMRTKSGTQRLLRWIGQRPPRRHADLDPRALLLDGGHVAQEGQGDLRLRGDARAAAPDARRLPPPVREDALREVRQELGHRRRGDDGRLARARLPRRLRARPAPLPGPADHRPRPRLHLPGAAVAPVHSRSSP